MNMHDAVVRPFTPETGLAIPPKFKLRRLAEFKVALQSEWLVKGLLPRHGFAAIYGPPSCGKSFLALDVAMHIAAGKEWAGRKVYPGAVVYVAGEGGSGVIKRLILGKRERGIPDDAPLFLVEVAPNLGVADGDTDTLIRDIRSQVGDLKLGAIVIDTLARSMGGGDENNAKDMGLFVSNVGKVAFTFGCLGIAVHHTGKAEGAGTRGSSALHGACDAEWEVKSDAQKSVRLAKMKDGEDGLEWVFRLVPGELGTDSEGDAITSCSVDVLTVPQHPETVSGRKKLKQPRGQKGALLLVVKKALSEAGIVPPVSSHLPENTQAVTADQIKAYAEKMNYGDAAGKPDSFRAMLSRDLNGLAGDGFIGRWNGWVWLK